MKFNLIKLKADCSVLANIPLVSKFPLIFLLIVLGFMSLPANAQLLNTAGIQPDSVQWQPCTNAEFSDWFKEEKSAVGVFCGYVEAPLIYSEGVQSSKVRLAVSRRPAKGVKKGSLVVINGGPGDPGIDPYYINLESPLIARLTESYDLIGYDPRGVGHSVPMVICQSPSNENAAPEQTDVAVADDEAEAKVKADDAAIQAYVDECVKYTGGQVLQHIGTHEAVNDLNVIRIALGEPALTALAYSYGTQVAAIYAERYPEYTRALVLDGVVDITEDSFTQDFNQARSYQNTFRRFAEACAQEIVDCPLPGDEKLAVEAYHKLLSKVHAEALTTSDGEKIASGEALLDKTKNLLLWRNKWPELINLLREVDRGNTSSEVVDRMSDNEDGQVQQPVYNSVDALISITCADHAAPGVDLEVLRKRRQAIRGVSPFSSYPPSQNASLSSCDLWPFPGKLQAHVPVVSPNLPSLLFVAQRYDATTPYANAQNMAKLFNSPLVTREDDGHTLALTGADQCVDEAVVEYLLSPEGGARDKVCEGAKQPLE